MSELWFYLTVSAPPKGQKMGEEGSFRDTQVYVCVCSWSPRLSRLGPFTSSPIF
jgi:hypothetical protein